jgi:hypothetical protein
MTDSESKTTTAASMEQVQEEWNALKSRMGQVEAEKAALAHEVKALRSLLERVVEHRQKSHTELVLLLTGLVSKLPINDIGVIVSKLVEHNTNLSQYLSAIAKGATDVVLPQPTVLKTLEQTKQDLLAALKPVLEGFIQLDPPFQMEMLRSLLTEPELFFTPRLVRANRCFMKGHVPRERVIREYGEEALLFFNDVTTDPKLNPRPKPDEIALAFKPDFEALFQQHPGALPQKREELHRLHDGVQRSKAATEQASSQRNGFHRMTFLLELLHYYEHQNTEAPDVIFAQRLPAVVEQLVVVSAPDQLEEKLILQAEALLAHVISPDHRQMIINNLGKGGSPGKTLRFVLQLRAEKVPDLDHVIAEFVRQLIPAPPGKAPRPASLAAVLRLVPADMQRLVVRSLMGSDRLRKDEAEALGKAIGAELGLKTLVEEIKAQEAVPPEVERQLAWARVKDLIARRSDPTAVAAAIRDRLNAKYDADEMRQSWITLTETDPISLIKIFCHLPYLANGKTDSIAKLVLETYVTRLTHEKYAATYKKVVNSLRNMFAAKPDSPTLVNFMALVRWVDPQAANRLSAEIGMPIPAASG